MTYQPRVSVFGRHAVKIEARPGEALDLDVIRAHAPALFAEQPHESRSERFAHIPTHDMIRALMNEGWAVTGVRVGGSSDAGKRAFTKHMLRLRRTDQLAGRKLNEAIPEVVLKNGHDGTSQYHLMLGLFRLICMNGMVVQDKSFGDVKVPHRGHAIDKVIEGTFTVLDHSTEVLGRVEAMQAVELNADERRVFAQATAQLRFEEVPQAIRENPGVMLAARRREDRANDLWTVYNRAQENLLKGGVGYRVASADETGLERITNHTTRAVQSVDGDIKLNRAIWTLAEEMRKLKA